MRNHKDNFLAAWWETKYLSKIANFFLRTWENVRVKHNLSLNIQFNVISINSTIKIQPKRFLKFQDSKNVFLSNWSTEQQIVLGFQNLESLMFFHIPREFLRSWSLVVWFVYHQVSKLKTPLYLSKRNIINLKMLQMANCVFVEPGSHERKNYICTSHLIIDCNNQTKSNIS